jgi:hypothetical protein
MVMARPRTRRVKGDWPANWDEAMEVRMRSERSKDEESVVGEGGREEGVAADDAGMDGEEVVTDGDEASDMGVVMDDGLWGVAGTGSGG